MRSIETTVALPMAEAEEAVRAALAENGFGVLTEIDVAATLRAKLGVDRPALKILGACNPDIANRALELDPSVALLLPCNVVLEPAPAGGTLVRAVDPRALMDAPEFAEVAGDAAARAHRGPAAPGRLTSGRVAERRRRTTNAPPDWSGGAFASGGGGENRTHVQGFAGPCLSHSATPPGPLTIAPAPTAPGSRNTPPVRRRPALGRTSPVSPRGRWCGRRRGWRRRAPRRAAR